MPDVIDVEPPLEEARRDQRIHALVRWVLDGDPERPSRPFSNRSIDGHGAGAAPAPPFADGAAVALSYAEARPQQSLRCAVCGALTSRTIDANPFAMRALIAACEACDPSPAPAPAPA